MFKNLHFNHINKDDHHNPNKLLLASTLAPCKFFTIDCESLEDGLTACPTLPIEIDVHTTMDILTSFHGLVCIGIRKQSSEYQKYSDLVLWNPLTGEYRTLGKDNIEYDLIHGTAFGLYYSSSDDDYKLLRVNTRAYIYSLKSDSWRKLGISSYYEGWYLHEHWRNSICLSEKLYFLREFKPLIMPSFQYEIIRFDTKTEKFSKITVPSFNNNNRPNLCGLSVVRGHVHFFVAFIEKCRFTKMVLWRMDEDGWMKVVTYSKLESFTPEIQKESPLYKIKRNGVWVMYSRDEFYLCEYMNNRQLHIMRNGNLIMHSRDEGYFCKVDLEKSLKDVSSSSMYKDILVQGTYVETFVSPNRYNMRTETDPLT
ncbi:uncharacterized protein LOC143544380 [Bidens hawaiensis]|uniref:uncharacterized protein LOC143544380 n=1 Tax=Bidens hawaiensis TaxID=980011 RepID=UPI00404919DD